jgi:hypothetical protein
VPSTDRRLRARLAAYHAGDISFAELDASIQGWIAYVGHVDSWGLRRHVLDSLVIRPGAHRRAVAARHKRHGKKSKRRWRAACQWSGIGGTHHPKSDVEVLVERVVVRVSVG